MDLRLRFDGTTPLLLHSDVAAMPGHPIHERRSRIADKKKKTDEDQQELLYLDWLGAFYDMNEEGVLIPTWNMVRTISKAASAARKQASVERALVPTEQFAPLIYPGPPEREKLWAEGWSDQRMIRNSGSGGRVPRCRPRFNTWSIETDFVLDTREMEARDLLHHAEVGGELHGFCDGRRLGFGRFTVEMTER